MDNDNQSPGKLLTLVPTKPEAEVAADLRKRITEKLVEVADLMNESVAAGLTISFGLQQEPGSKLFYVPPVQICRIYGE